MVLHYFQDIKAAFLDSWDLKETWGNIWKVYYRSFLHINWMTGGQFLTSKLNFLGKIYFFGIYKEQLRRLTHNRFPPTPNISSGIYSWLNLCDYSKYLLHNSHACHCVERTVGDAFRKSCFIFALGWLRRGAFLHVNGLVTALWGQFLFILSS